MSKPKLKPETLRRFAEDYEPGTVLQWPEPPMCGAIAGEQYRARLDVGMVSFLIRGVALCRFGRGEPTPVLPGQPCARRV